MSPLKAAVDGQEPHKASGTRCGDTVWGHGVRTLCTPVGLSPGLAPVRRDTLHRSESAPPHPGPEPVLAAAGSEDPDTGCTWSAVSCPRL